MLTFSVNTNIDTIEIERVKKVVKLVKELNDFTAEHIGAAYISIMNNENDGKDSSLSSYVKIAERNNLIELNRMVSLSQDDGYLEDIRLSYTEENKAVNNADLDNNVKYFLDLREKWFLKKGVDLYRLVVLVDTYKDKSAAEKLYFLLKENNELDLFSDLFNNKGLIKSLHKILD